ncbi:hypothetical protein BOTBODRAFT_30310 [Botryobasidium botryosum FD-172 SS1]|uniref:Histone-lysine N-methyltransferase, H3 lysine-36 specific n=1 Tax=Botryobasidium botryosum (strain FD-172 SS1) TaxID=930990 RepID=A0A067MME6_BOTB1|nr:hypothetical protein BOTBODRAFT_30310 [Botryobasidium botryosum FD-172 SS1]
MAAKSSRAAQLIGPPTLIGHLPRSEEQALETFEAIPDCIYQSNAIGRNPQQEDESGCDCTYDPATPQSACGYGSNCINRLTMMECLDSECKARSHCQNQRFQRKQYANIEVVLTEKKGFGLRAGADLEPETFVYEYVGEVVTERSFMKRMAAYAKEGIKHFYFMMLQKGEFIDATKKGGIGRFANHSCNPNCYVSKWFVGKKVRMGIFAKRRILQGEELTFNYNVDRYGHDAQICYCGEPNCIGVIGGKTQTDVGIMDDFYVEALDISDDEAQMMREQKAKRKKNKKSDDEYMPSMKPVTEQGAPTVVSALVRLRLAEKPTLLRQMMTRVTITKDPNVIKELFRLRVFGALCGIVKIRENKADVELMKLTIKAFLALPPVTKLKIEGMQVSEEIRSLLESDDSELQLSAQELLDKWDTMEAGYRIPKAKKREITPESDHDSDLDGHNSKEWKRTRRDHIEDVPSSPDGLPPGSGNPFFIKPRGFAPVAKQTSVPQKPPSPPPPTPVAKPAGASKAELDAIIAAALAETEAKMAEARAKEAAIEAEAAKAAQKKARKARKEAAPKVDRDKRMTKLVGELVVKYMSRFKSELSHDQFKKYAKELTSIIVEKEKKSSSYQTLKLDKLGDDKKKKMKIFIKEYIDKVLKKIRQKKGQSSTPRSVSSTIKDPDAMDFQSNGTPDNDHGDMSMMVNEMFGDDEYDGEGDEEEDGDGDQLMVTVPATRTPTGDPRSRSGSSRSQSQEQSGAGSFSQTMVS